MADQTPSTPTNTADTSVTQESSTPEVTEELDASSEGDAEKPKDKPKEAKASEKTSKKKLKIKVDGKEEEEEFDFDDDERLVKDRQLAKVAQKRIAEFAQLQKEVREFVEQLRSNPRAILADPDIGIDLKQLAASIMQEELENSQKSPEVLEKEKLEKELKKLREDQERKEKEFQQKEFERLQEREFERMDVLMSQALEKTDLPKSPYVIKKMADYMILGLQNEVDVTPEDVLPIVRDEIMSDIKAMFTAMPEEVIENWLGKDMIAKLRKRSLAKAKATPPPVSKAIVDSGKKADEKKADQPKKTIRELWGI